MINTYTHNKLVWIDLESPTQSEVREVMEKYGIHPLVAEQLLAPTLKPKVDLYKDYIYLILHFPALKHTHQLSSNQEVDFIIGKDFIITCRYDTIDALHKFSRVFEVNSILDKSNMGEHAGFIFFYMVKELYESIENEIDFLEDRRLVVEGYVFDGKERDMVVEISKMFKSILDLKQSLSAHGEVLSSFEVAGKKIFGDDFGYYLRTIAGEYFRVNAKVQNELDSVKELRETNNSLLYAKQNEAMKVLAIMAFVTYPLSLIAGIFGMNTDTTPIVGNSHDFWIIIGIMLAMTVVFFWYFKHKKWL